MDLSPRHKETREKLERRIREYKEGIPHLPEVREWRMPVLVAPYGSGKSTLMRYLVRYCWRKLKIPALKVNLSELVAYLDTYLRRNNLKRIHADRLPEVVEEFFDLKLAELDRAIRVRDKIPRGLLGLPYDKNLEEYLLPEKELLDIIKYFKQREEAIGVLFIDEVEEAREDLERYVSYETTPFRGLADDVVHHRLKVFPVLALGPTTELRELTFGPGGWRVERIDIPIVGRDYAQRLLSERIKERKEILELLANTAWWMAKGRVGWLYKIADTLASIATMLSDPHRLEQELMRPGTVLDEEIIEGVQLMDKAYLRRLLSNRDYERRLLLLSTILVGPIPLHLLRELGLKEVDIYRLPQTLATGRRLIKVEDLERAFEEALKDVLSKEELSNAMWIIGEVLKAWSCDGYIIYDLECLKELKDIISDYAYDLFPLIGREISRLRTENLDVKYVEKDEVYVALRPSCISHVYPPLTLQPLIGLAKGIPPGELYNWLARLSWEEFREVSEHILFEVLGFKKEAFEKGVPLLLIASSRMLHKLDDLLFESIRREERPILVVLAGNYDENQRLDASLKRKYRLFFNTVASTLLLSERESLYLLSLAYNVLKGQDFEKLSPAERRAYSWYNNILKLLIGRAYYGMPYESRVLNYFTSLKGTYKIAEWLKNNKERQVGRGRALVFYLNAAFPQNIKKLVDIIRQLSNVREKLEKLLKVLRSAGADIEDVRAVVDETFRDISLLTRSSAASFLKRVEELYSRAEIEVGSDQLDYLAKLLSSYVRGRMDIDSFYEAMTFGYKKIRWIVGGLADPEVTYVLLSGALERLGRTHDPIITFYSPAMRVQLQKINELSRNLERLRRRLYEVIEELNDKYGVDLSTNKLIQELMSSMKESADEVNRLVRYCSEAKESALNDLGVADSLLRIALLEGLKRFEGRGIVSEGILKVFANNLENLRGHLAWLNLTIDKIIGGLRIIEEGLTAEIPEKEELVENIKKDLEDAAKPPQGTLNDLCSCVASVAESVRQISKLCEEYDESIGELRQVAEELINRLNALAEEVG